MSKRINVNPDHYKVAGRERQGEGIVRDTRQLSSPERTRAAKWREQQQKRKKRA
jgi:hypothetical protein